MKLLLRDKVAKLSFVALLAASSAAMLYTQTAAAHGEKSQAAFMRMRTIHCEPQLLVCKALQLKKPLTMQQRTILQLCLLIIISYIPLSGK